MDRDLVERAQRNDREAFAILARSHGDRLMAIAQRILRDVGRAEDAVQQTLVIAWGSLPSLRDPDRFEAWLQRLLVHACYAEARRSRAWNANVRVLPIAALAKTHGATVSAAARAQGAANAAAGKAKGAAAKGSNGSEPGGLKDSTSQ